MKQPKPLTLRQKRLLTSITHTVELKGEYKHEYSDDVAQLEKRGAIKIAEVFEVTPGRKYCRIVKND